MTEYFNCHKKLDGPIWRCDHYMIIFSLPVGMNLLCNKISFGNVYYNITSSSMSSRSSKQVLDSS